MAHYCTLTGLDQTHAHTCAGTGAGTGAYTLLSRVRFSPRLCDLGVTLQATLLERKVLGPGGRHCTGCSIPT
eukprot:scaffold294505_cov19-Tisochrysis_lutea.AAC.2